MKPAQNGWRAVDRMVNKAKRMSMHSDVHQSHYLLLNTWYSRVRQNIGDGIVVLVIASSTPTY